MKKNIIALLLVLAVVSFGVFAAPADADFKVTTEVGDNSFMGVTKETVDVKGFVSGAYTDFDELVVEEAGSQDFEAYLTSWSNSVAGYTIEMSATPMAHANKSSNSAADIHYTVTVNSVSYATKSDTTAKEVFDSETLTAITGNSSAITLSVDSDSFAAAATGSYEGTVTFHFVSNS